MQLCMLFMNSSDRGKYLILKTEKSQKGMSVNCRQRSMPMFTSTAGQRLLYTKGHQRDEKQKI